MGLPTVRLVRSGNTFSKGAPRRNCVPTALVTGLAGQDGTYLAELLLAKGYEVHGLVRDPRRDIDRLPASLRGNVRLHQGDIRAGGDLQAAIRGSRPDELYHLAAESFVHGTVDRLIETAETNGLGVMRLLDAVVQEAPRARVYLAGSSEMFGDPLVSPQDEEAAFRPRNPYGIAKLAAFWAGRYYRQRHGLFVANGILFNHESPRRPPTYVTRKVCRAAVAVARGDIDSVTLGRLDSQRDWGYAPEYVDGMWRMLQAPDADDFVLGTGTTHTVEQLVAAAFRAAGVPDWRPHVRIDATLGSPEGGQPLRADPGKARRVLGWRAHTTFEPLVDLMVKAEQALPAGAA